MARYRGWTAGAARGRVVAAGLAACLSLAACASSGDEGTGGPFGFLPKFDDDGGATAQRRADASRAGGKGQKASEPATTAPTQTAGGEDADAGTMAGGSDDAREQAELAPRYCYRTLAEVDCYSAPRPDRARQRVGSFHDTVQ